ncbi:MAG: response regulator transcription factor [Caldilineales bacterium]|nr:response regulator transcription factor [Caldilineales bacterium]
MNQPIRVLIADDNAVFRQGLCRLLASDPEIEVVGEAGDGYAAVEQALACAPDVVLMDIRMPGQSGLEAARQIWLQRPQIKIIVLTEYDSTALRAKTDQVGIAAYLTKQVDSSELLKTIHKTIP